MTEHNGPIPRVVIVGGGFGGLAAAKELAGLPVDVVLFDQRNHHTFQPLLYQVASAGLDSDDVAHSVRGIVRREGGTTTRLATVQEVDLEARKVVVSSTVASAQPLSARRPAAVSSYTRRAGPRV